MTRSADELVDSLDHVHRDADGAGLIGDGAGDGLANPPGCVGGELVAAAVFEFVDGFHQADVALLNQVEELQAAVGVLFGDGDDEAEVGFDQLALGLVGVHVALDHLALGALQLDDETPASTSIFSRSALQFFCWRRYSFLSSSLRLASCFCSSERIWRSRVRMVSTVLLTLSSRRLRSMGSVLELADDARDEDFFAGDEPAGVARGGELGLVSAGGHGSLLLFERGNLLLVLDERVDAGDGGFDAGLHDIFRELFLVEDDDFFYVAHAALEVFAEGDDLADDDGRAGDGLEHAELAALDALGDFDFAFAGEQRNGAHFAQIHAHGVVGLLERARRQVELDIFALFKFEVLVGAELGAVEQVNALCANGGDEVVEVVGGADLIWQDVVDIAVGEIAFFLADLDEAVNVVFEFVVNCQNNPAL